MKDTIIYLTTALLVVALATSAAAVDKCKVKVNKKTGAITVLATKVDSSGVLGTLKWGADPSDISRDFFNSLGCIAGGKAINCELADPATLASKTPPAGCTIYLADDSGTNCQVWIKGCVPGVRSATDDADIAAVLDKTQCMSATATDTYFDGCNVHVRSGKGTTDAAVNGLGNLIVGYDEDLGGDTKTGSHNLILGVGQTYTSYGGLVAGWNNEISGTYASVSGGSVGTASGLYSSVSGGLGDVASGTASAALGGEGSIATNNYSLALGGESNIASGSHTVVSGGVANTASNAYATANGGAYNTASGVHSSVNGGYANLSNGFTSAVNGGKGNLATGDYSSVGGGNLRTAYGIYDWRAGSLWEDF